MARVPLPHCVPVLSGLSVCKKIGLGYVPATSFMLAVAALSLLVLRTDRFDGRLADTLQAVLIAGLLVSAVASISAMLTAFNVGERVRTLLTVAEAAAGGDLDHYVPYRQGGDEVDRLAASFNTMTAELRQRVEAEQDARHEAEAASDAKSQFLSAMSHEIRTPLTILIGFSDILQESARGRLSAKEEAYISKMHQAAQHLLSVANDALDISRVEAGQTNIDIAEVDLRELLDPAVESVRPLADERGHSLTLEAPPRVVSVQVDPMRMRQVLYNLLSNAIKFTPPGGSIVLRAEVAESDLVLEVEDTGIGIPADQRALVFEEFERLHTDLIKAPGAGLGLALSRRLVTLHGGEIDFDSTIGVGTTFFVRLPGAVTASEPLPAPAHARNGHLSLVHPFAHDPLPDSGLRVLLIDDEPLNTDLFSEILEADGHHVAVEHDARAGELRAMSEPYDLVLMDIRMPGMRGDELCRLLRSRGMRVPMVAISANAMPDEVEHGLAAGFDAYLTKPIKPDALRRAVYDVVEQHHHIAGARAGLVTV